MSDADHELLRKAISSAENRWEAPFYPPMTVESLREAMDRHALAPPRPPVVSPSVYAWLRQQGKVLSP